MEIIDRETAQYIVDTVKSVCGKDIPVYYHGKVIAAVGISGDVEEARKYAALAQKITTILLRERELEARGSQKRSKISYMLRTLIRQDITDYTELKALFKENGIRESGKYR